MTHHPRPGHRRGGFALATVASLALAGLVGTSYASVSGTAVGRGVDHHSARATLGQSVHDPYVDVTSQGGQAQTHALRVAGRVSRQAAVRTFRAAQPDGTVLDLSGTTGTVRWLGNLSGTLTGRSTRSAKAVALGYVRHHTRALGLTAADLSTFHLARTYRDIVGTRHLFFTQRISGTSTGRNGLTASVDRAGRLLTLGGMPVSTSRASKVATRSLTITTAAQALARTRGPVTTGADTAQDTAHKVLFETGHGLRPAWETVVTSSQTPATTVVDAITGQVLLRTPLTQYEHSTGRAYRFFPGARRGGHQVKVDFTKRHWLGKHAHILSGNNAHAFSDVDDNNRPSRSEEVHAKRGQSWGYRLQPFHPGFAKRFCSNPWPCSWNPDKPFSWEQNRAQNATQVFFYVNNWHDHLKKAPIGFTEAAGNFQSRNHSKHGRGGDPVSTQTDDGANTLINRKGQRVGLPDDMHVDNANMTTPPDGRRPTMQMYLQHTPFTSYPDQDPFSPTNVGDEADTVYHEYTHGLSNRLNVDVHGRTTLGGVQAGAMGEGWSDWYAMDYLVDKKLQRDRPRKADVRMFLYDGKGVKFDRTEPMDCKVGQRARLCKGGATGHRGGYTYADYGKVVGGPEVHGDGEIWAQTLWDLRHRLGSRKSEALVTRAMELAPYNPSFLDMRNAILVADTAVFGGTHHAAIWRVFAHRGMGFYAGSLGGNDTSPAASFARPPATIGTGSITGLVKDRDSNTPLGGITVTLAFQGSGAVNPTAITDANGRYTLTGIPQGHYRKLLARGRGYQAQKAVTVTSGVTTVNFAVRRDWAGPGSGAGVDSASGQDYSAFGCGPAGAIDGSQLSGWSTNAGPGRSTDGTLGFQAKQITIDLHRVVEVKGFAVDPSATCGDDPSSSTAGYVIQTSPDGTTFTTAASGTFTSADNGSLVPLDVDVSGVRFVRFRITSDQVPDFASTCAAGGPSGCQFADVSEIQVFGVPS